MGNLYGTYTERIGTYNDFTNCREGCTERIGTYNFQTTCLKHVWGTHTERIRNVK